MGTVIVNSEIGGEVGLIPGWGTKILRAMWCAQKMTKTKQQCSICPPLKWMQ